MKQILKGIDSGSAAAVAHREADGWRQNLFMQKRHLMSERAKLSNRLFESTTDQQRASISYQIQEIQANIEAINVKLREGEEKDLKDDKYPIPSNLIDLLSLQRKRKNLIIKTQGNLRLLAAKSDPKAAKKIEAKEEHLKHLKIHVQLIDAAVAKATIHEGTV